MKTNVENVKTQFETLRTKIVQGFVYELKRISKIIDDNTVMLNEHDISNCIHKDNDLSELVETIYAVSLNDNDNVIFHIDNCTMNDYTVEIEDVSNENLLYLLEELQGIEE